ncbi:helix-turn-helix domain-containing protein [Brevibacillus sp. HB2.2]|uniref:helix-turn-helix domain-containing protein n=1 Tax=Brevibacillus sp. HB2.2 TaxID=2738846 RepID=UPI00156A8964|nr:helix-turn-helix transcriptional regulator [Brevibacillus sp. HB2.2]NRS51011.1 helix-turn-helix transcriptional regulator [Brevibacillus sp. HB2.2]
MHNRIRELREKRGLRLEALAKLVNISKGYMSQIETGARGKKICYPLLTRIATALETTAEYLMNGEANDQEAEQIGSRAGH